MPLLDQEDVWQGIVVVWADAFRLCIMLGVGNAQVSQRSTRVHIIFYVSIVCTFRRLVTPVECTCLNLSRVGQYLLILV